MNESSGASMPGSDAELLNAIRSGDPRPYDLLRARHAAAARRLAGHLVADPAAADAAVAEAFEQVLDAIRRGGGPTDAFRPYLLTAVRRAAGNVAGAGPQVPIDEQQIPDPGQLLADPATTDLAASPIVAAFLSLPERWRAVLWHTDVEGATPPQAARLLGLPEAGAADLADQARAGLARAYRPPQQAAGHATAGAAAALDDAHADADAASAALRSTLAPLVLGEAAQAYLAGLAGSADSPSTRPGPGTDASSGTATSRLSGKLRGSSSRQRTVVVGAGALLAVAAIGGYALTLSPAPGQASAASDHQTPAGVTSRSGSPAPGSSADASAAPQSTAPQTVAPRSAAPSPAPSSPGRATAPASGRAAPRRRPAATAPGTSPTSARPLLATPSPALAPPPAASAPSSPPAAAAPSSPPAAAGSWSPPAQGTTQVTAVGTATFSHVAAVNLGAAATRLFTLVITGSAGCGRSVHVTVTAGAPAASPLSAGTIPCGWSRATAAAAPARERSPGFHTGATSADAAPDATAAPSTAPSKTVSGYSAGAVSGWHRGAWPPVTWPWAGARWPGARWPTRQWTGNHWPSR
jgi:DNA-directed RNA polymerase specialized sigma24 family protein